MSEEKLLERIKDHPAVFSELFDLYYKPIFGYIFRRTGNFDDTADIASDTFLKAFTGVHKFSYRGISIKIWLYRIATNEVNLYYRQQRRHINVFEGNTFGDIEQFNHYKEEDRKEMEAELINHNQFISVLNHLKTLPVKYQEVIALRYFEGKDNKEIAMILDMRDGTLKSLLSRGLEKLRTKCNEI